jgi:hypothetical protein
VAEPAQQRDAGRGRMVLCQGDRPGEGPDALPLLPNPGRFSQSIPLRKMEKIREDRDRFSHRRSNTYGGARGKDTDSLIPSIGRARPLRCLDGIGADCAPFWLVAPVRARLTDRMHHGGSVQARELGLRG